MTEWRMAVAAGMILLAALSGCSSREVPQDDWIAVRAGTYRQLGTRRSCRLGTLACLRRHGSGWYVREIRPGLDHSWAWLGEHPGTPGTYYLADGRGTWGTASSVAEVRARHGYVQRATSVMIVNYQDAERTLK